MSDNVDLEKFNAPSAAEAAEGAGEDAPAVADGGESETMTAVRRVPVDVRIVLGSTKMTVAEVLQLNRGAVIEVNKRVGEPVDIMVNDRLVARGELVVVEDNRLGVTLTEIVKDNGLSAV